MELKLGLVEGRHPLPVDTYVFDKIEDVTNAGDLEKKAVAFLEERFNKTARQGHVAPASYTDYTDVRFQNNEQKLVVYVTGLTVALVAVLNATRIVGINKAEVMHFNRNTDDYFCQEVVW